MIENIIFWKYFDIFLALIEIGIFCYMSSKIDNPKTSKRFRNKFFSVVLLITFLMRFFEVNPNIRLILALIISIVYYKSNFMISTTKSVLKSFIYWLYIMIVEMFSVTFVIMVNKLQSSEALIMPSSMRLEAVIISKILLIISVYLLVKIYPVKKPKYIRKLASYISKEYIYIFIPIFTNLFSLLVIYMKSVTDFQDRVLNDTVMFFIVFLLFISNISLVIITVKIIRDNRLIIENEFNNSKEKMESNYFIKVEENNYKVRQLYHDMKNHLVCISQLCDNDDSKIYLKNLNFQLNKLDKTFDTGNRVLNIILSEKKSRCIENGINLNTYVDFSRSDFIEMSDVNTIFGNLLDNAIQACNKIENNDLPKKIDLRVFNKKGFCIIDITNTKVNQIVKKKNKIFTTKEDDFLHGIGIKNIETAVKKYNGELTIDYSDKYFKVTIIIPI
ncbi:sensor histidine kinase [Metaclostridioides mangenotii]|uniref:sensor histidine kinase n=1 Tax=Metaclostridioides mangenotii TaxID=1540 RepID=UPI0028E97954|nr:GHKL domain-containing protein [Clostridioides mangenotii]